MNCVATIIRDLTKVFTLFNETILENLNRGVFYLGSESSRIVITLLITSCKSLFKVDGIGSFHQAIYPLD